MDLNKKYLDSDDHKCTILQMVKLEPEWAANRIQEGEKWYEIVKDCERIFDIPDTADAPHLSNLPNLIRDLKAWEAAQEKPAETTDSTHRKGHRMTNPQQRVYDILKAHGTWTNKAQLRKEYYHGFRESYDVYMGRLLAELDKLGLVEERPATINGKTCSYSEYRLRATETPLNGRLTENEVSDAETEKATNRQRKPAWGVNWRQEDSACKCGSWYTVEGKCRCGIQREKIQAQIEGLR